LILYPKGKSDAKANKLAFTIYFNYLSFFSRYVHNKEPKGKTIRRADGSITRPVQVQVTCPHCDKTLSSLTRLKDHIKNIHETNKTYKCPSCHKAFGTMQSKRQHLKIAKSCQKKAMKIEAGGGQPRYNSYIT
jgi:uncharacterized protein with PIN domain